MVRKMKRWNRARKSVKILQFDIARAERETPDGKSLSFLVKTVDNKCNGLWIQVWKEGVGRGKDCWKSQKFFLW